MTSLPTRLVNLAALAVLVVAALTGCSAMQAQNPPGRLKPVNAVADGAEARLMLKGADVVAYFTEQRHRQGTPEHRSEYQGVAVRFARAEHKRQFESDPEAYIGQRLARPVGFPSADEGMARERVTIPSMAHEA